MSSWVRVRVRHELLGYPNPSPNPNPNQAAVRIPRERLEALADPLLQRLKGPLYEVSLSATNPSPSPSPSPNRTPTPTPTPTLTPTPDPNPTVTLTRAPWRRCVAIARAPAAASSSVPTRASSRPERPFESAHRCRCNIARINGCSEY